MGFRNHSLGRMIAALALGAATSPVQALPAAPDYSLPASWAAMGTGHDPGGALPAGASPKAQKARADVFYVHPTTFRDKGHSNQDVADAATNRWTDASVIARQASIFNGCCRVFAPRYRQAAFMKDQKERLRALELAYTDVERAFDHFIAHQSEGRPFILAGHSQGGFMVAQLLERRIAGTGLANRMVAAYVIGINLTEGEVSRRFGQVGLCARPDQTGCLVQWNAVLSTADMTGPEKPSEAGKTMLCINPLTFDATKPKAPADSSLGAVPGEPGEGALRPLIRGAVSARCDKGYLVVDPSPKLQLTPLPGGSMHYHDLGLFYADVRANALLRVNSYLRTQLMTMMQNLSRRDLLLASAASLLLPSMARSAEGALMLPSFLLKTADGRAVETWHWRARGKRRGIIAFSHGALSAPRKYALLIAPWVAAGYDVVAPLHVDSTDHPRTADYPGLASWKARIEDMRAISAYIVAPYIAAGHSYGGLTALMLGGVETVVPDGISTPLRDGNARAVIAFSPPPALPALVRSNGYGALAVPALIQTGTRDVPPASAGTDGWRAHLDAYEAARPGGERYAMILDEVDHYFGGAICEPDKPGPRRTGELAQAVDISLLFLSACAAHSSKAGRALKARIGRDRAMVLGYK